MSKAGSPPGEASQHPPIAAGRPAHHNSRLVERQSVLIGVELCPGGETWLPGRVTDISSEGCRLVTTAEIAPDMAVQLMFPGFAARAARIVWRQGEQAGCAFTPALPPAIFDYIVRMSDPAARG